MWGGRRWQLLSAEDKSAHISCKLIRRVLSCAKPYSCHLFFTLITIAFNSALSLTTPLISREIIDTVIPSGNLKLLFYLCGGLLVSAALSALFSIIQRYLTSSVGEGLVRDLRVKLFSHMQNLSLSFFAHTKSGELMSRINNDVQGAQSCFSNTFVGLIYDVVSCCTVCAMMFILNWKLACIAIVVIPFFIIAAKIGSSKLTKIARDTLDASASMNALAQETLSISGVIIVNLFNLKELMVERFKENATTIRNRGVKRAVLSNSLYAFIGLFTTIGTTLVYGFGGWLSIKGNVSIGTIVAFTSTLRTFYSSMQDLANLPADISTAFVSFQRVFEICDIPLSIIPHENALLANSCKGDFAFANVTFTYKSSEEAKIKAPIKRYGTFAETSIGLFSSSLTPSTSRSTPKIENGKSPSINSTENVAETTNLPTNSHNQAREIALENVSFAVESGKMIAIVGPSGAGKTTITYLIPRLYDPENGNVTLDGIDIREFDLASLRSVIGMVTQETHLFHDTIRSNLLHAKPNATQEEIETACKIANIFDFIEKLPEKYDTIVGERGYRLSGGEKQRVAIARVVLKNPKILVLDEATSSLDSESETLIQEALKRVMVGRTSIVIAHRLSTILAADRIIVMDCGKVVESGTHKELLCQNGLYAHLYTIQFNKKL